MNRIRLCIAVCALTAAGFAASRPPLELLRQITSERYPDANAVTVFDSTAVTLEASGAYVSRTHHLAKILTEDGLNNNSRTWDEYCLTYSKATLKLARVITPSGKVIDVNPKDIVDIPVPVEEGSKFILPNVRVISAQFPGLEIGSAVEWITEDRMFNPVMEGYFDDMFTFQGQDPALSLCYTITAPAAMNLRWVVKDGAVQKNVSGRAGLRTYSWFSTDVHRIVYEPMMPYSPEGVPRLLVTNVPDWQTWSRWYYHLCAPRLEPDSTLAAAIAALVAGAPDPPARIRALYDFVDAGVRYVEVSYSGKKAVYQPEMIGTTYAKRYGVCRDKAALLAGMLRHVGVDADIVLTNPGAQTDSEVPVDNFDHAIVAVKQPGGGFFYLDPTAENSRQFLPGAEMNRGVLVCDSEGEGLRYTPLVPADSNLMRVMIVDTLSADGTLSGFITMQPTGTHEFRWRSQAKYQPPAQQKQNMERTLRLFGPATTLDTLITTDAGDMTVPYFMKLHFTARDFAVLLPRTIRFTLPKSGSGTFASTSMGWAASMPVRKYPVDFHSTLEWHLSHQMTLPAGWRVRLLPDTLKRDLGRFAVDSRTGVAGRTLTNDVVFRLNDPYVPLADYPKLRDLIAAGEEIERQHVMLKKGEE